MADLTRCSTCGTRPQDGSIGVVCDDCLEQFGTLNVVGLEERILGQRLQQALERARAAEGELLDFGTDQEEGRAFRTRYTRSVVLELLVGLLPEIFAKCPSVTRRDLEWAVRTIFPPSDGPEAKGASTFDSDLVRAIHRELQRLGWSCENACEELAEFLNVDARGTIRRALRPSPADPE